MREFYFKFFLFDKIEDDCNIVLEHNYSSPDQLCTLPHNNISLARARLSIFPCLNLIKSAWEPISLVGSGHNGRVRVGAS